MLADDVHWLLKQCWQVVCLQDALQPFDIQQSLVADGWQEGKGGSSRRRAVLRRTKCVSSFRKVRFEDTMGNRDATHEAVGYRAKSLVDPQVAQRRE